MPIHSPVDVFGSIAAGWGLLIEVEVESWRIGNESEDWFELNASETTADVNGGEEAGRGRREHSRTMQGLS